MKLTLKLFTIKSLHIPIWLILSLILCPATILAKDYSLDMVPLTTKERHVIDRWVAIESTNWFEKFNSSEPEPLVVIHGVENQDEYAGALEKVREALRSGKHNTLLNVLLEYGLVYGRDYSDKNSDPAVFGMRLMRDDSAGMNLRVAVELGDVNGVQQFFEQGNIDVNDRIHFYHSVYFGENEYTALQLATFNKQVDIMKYLLQQGADPSISDLKSDTSPMYFALLHETPESAKLLIEAGADVDEPVGFVGKELPLNMVAINGRSDLVKLLLEHGANPNAQNHNGLTPLLAAIASTDVDTINNLLQVADPRLLTFAEYKDWSFPGGQYDYVPFTNALALARLVELENRDEIERAIYERANSLDEIWGEATLNLGAAMADSFVAYHGNDIPKATLFLKEAFEHFDVSSLDESVPEYLFYLMKLTLETKHELDVIQGNQLSDSERALVAYMAKKGVDNRKWHDMLDVIASSDSNGQLHELQNNWIKDHGKPVQNDTWGYDRLDSWAASIQNEQRRKDVKSAIDFFNPPK